MPTSRETTFNAVLSGGNNLATALSLNACPYRATEILHRRPLIVEFYWHDNYADAAETPRTTVSDSGHFTVRAVLPLINMSGKTQQSAVRVARWRSV
jgi:hypothetical protein